MSTSDFNLFDSITWSHNFDKTFSISYSFHFSLPLNRKVINQCTPIPCRNSPSPHSKILTVSRYSIKNRPNLKRALAKQLHRQQRFVYLLTGEISFTTLESTGDEGGIGRERGRKKNFIGLRTTNDCLTRYIKKISIFIINFIVI